MSKSICRMRLAGVAGITTFAVVPAAAGGVADFHKGKQIAMVVGRGRGFAARPLSSAPAS